jgi:RHS repeat-associated protein
MLSMSHLLSVLHRVGSTTLDGAGYGYDFAGNRTSKTNSLNGITSNYGYDAIYELQQVTQGSSTTESYSYDAVGNRLSSLGVNPYSYNASNELTATPSGSYTYDNNGSTLTDASGKSYTWDFENRMASAVVPGTGTVTFKCDPLGRRIQKSSPLGTTNYLYDGLNLIEEVDSIGNVLTRYAQTEKIDEPLTALRSGGSSYYEADGLGSVTSLSNTVGTLANTYTYDSFGKLTASTGTLANLFQYTGREFDLETGIYEYRVRYYDQTVGRFIGEDPVRFKAGTNFYRYVENNPARFTDPTGNNPFQHWPLNGNIWPQFTKQDEVCTTGPFANTMNSRPCIKKCCSCKGHDDCYTKYNCNFSSFLGGLPFGPCHMCNADVEACILTADKSPGGGDCKCSK